MSVRTDKPELSDIVVRDLLPRCRKDSFETYGHTVRKPGSNEPGFEAVTEGWFGARWGFKADPARPGLFIVHDLGVTF
jgi:hypothetical protein